MRKAKKLEEYTHKLLVQRTVFPLFARALKVSFILVIKAMFSQQHMANAQVQDYLNSHISLYAQCNSFFSIWLHGGGVLDATINTGKTKRKRRYSKGGWNCH